MLKRKFNNNKKLSIQTNGKWLLQTNNRRNCFFKTCSHHFYIFSYTEHSILTPKLYVSSVFLTTSYFLHSIFFSNQIRRDLPRGRYIQAGCVKIHDFWTAFCITLFRKRVTSEKLRWAKVPWNLRSNLVMLKNTSNARNTSMHFN